MFKLRFQTGVFEFTSSDFKSASGILTLIQSLESKRGQGADNLSDPWRFGLAPIFSSQRTKQKAPPFRAPQFMALDFERSKNER